MVQALSGLNFDKFKEAVKGYTFAITKPPRDEMAFQQVLFPAFPYYLLCVFMTGLHGSGVIGILRHKNWWYRGDSSFLMGQKSFMRTRMKGLLIMLQWQMF